MGVLLGFCAVRLTDWVWGAECRVMGCWGWGWGWVFV